MGRLLDFLMRFHAFFLFLGLEVFCFYLYSKNVEYASGQVFHSANSVSGGFHQTKSDVKNWFNLQHINDSLMADNARLHALMQYSRAVDSLNEYCVEDSAYRQLYTYYPARVVNNQVNRRNNYVTINLGSKDSVKKDMGVIGTDGIVGKVVQVGDNYSVVMTVLHSKFSVSAAIKKDNTLGRLTWNGRHAALAQLNDVSSHVELKPGDKIITTGYSALFPEGLEIGKIDQIRYPESSHFLEVEVRLNEDMTRLRNVFVVNYLQREAREAAENLVDGG